MLLTLTYFHQIKGPSVLISYPEVHLEEDIVNRLLKFFDLEIDETFFEIVLITKKKKIINFHFEIPSEWARGKKEFAMLSLIMKREYESELVYAFIVDASYKILKTNNVFKALYKDERSDISQLMHIRNELEEKLKESIIIQLQALIKI